MRKITLFLLFLSLPANACLHDWDCQGDASCIKADNAWWTAGVCIGGAYPGNKNDKRPYESALSKTFGNTCTMSLECESQEICKKEKGQLDGVCLR